MFVCFLMVWGAKENDNGRIRTYAPNGNSLAGSRLNHSATLSLHLSVVWVYMSASCVSRQDEASIGRECSSDGRALALHARGRGIDTPHFHCIVCFFLSGMGSSTQHASSSGESVKWINGRNRRESGEAVALTSYWSRHLMVKESCVSVNLIRSVWTN